MRVGSIACVAIAVAFACASLPSIARAQAGVLVVQLPFQGEANQELLRSAEDGVRNAVLARGAQGPDRSTVQNAMGVAPPSTTDAIVTFGRNMGATHVLSGRVTPLTGQYNLELKLYDVSTGRLATQQRNVGDGEEATVFPEMMAALFAPGAMQASPEEQARLAEEQRRLAAERQHQEAAERAEQDRQRREAEQRRQDEERQRREAALRARRVYRVSDGGPVSLGAALELGARVTAAPPRPASAPPASALLAGLRVNGGYTVVPSAGLEIGASLLILGTPTTAFAIGLSARVAYPSHAYVPVRASLGFTGGVFKSITGAQSTAPWLAGDLRVELDVTTGFTLFAGVAVDGVPGAFAAVAGSIGAQVRFGGGSDSSAAPASAATTPTSTTTTSAPAAPPDGNPGDVGSGLTGPQ